MRTTGWVLLGIAVDVGQFVHDTVVVVGGGAVFVGLIVFLVHGIRELARAGVDEEVA